MKPSEVYKQRILSEHLEASTLQSQVLQLLDEYYENFEHNKTSSLKAGIYLWGTVGSGKTMLLDIFYKELPSSQKKRMHFHEFINQIHSELKTITGKQDPLTILTKKFAKVTKFLFLDELIIGDIGNALILKNLFMALIEQGVFIITSSNTQPHDLYHDGINRELFLPAIAFIEENFQVAKLDSIVDYRSLNTTNNNNYFYPITEKTELMMLQQFAATPNGRASITICNREVSVIKEAHDYIWFEFEEIIMPPRSYQDYLYLANNFKHIFISNVREISASETNLIYNFCHLVDICYDKQIHLVLAATCDLESIFKCHLDSKTIMRTKSRLIAMQSL